MGVARGGGEEESWQANAAVGFLLHLAYDCYGSVSSSSIRSGGEREGAAPWGRQLVQDYVLCTAPPLTFMALPFGGCGCSFAPFFSLSFAFFSGCCCLCYLPHSAYT